MSKANTLTMAKEIYQRQCEYVGVDHEGRSIEFIKRTLDSFDVEIDNLTARIAKLEALLLHKTNNRSTVRNTGGKAKRRTRKPVVRKHTCSDRCTGGM